MNDREQAESSLRPLPASWFGMAAAVIVLGLLSFAVGLWLLASPRTDAPADRSGLLAAAPPDGDGADKRDDAEQPAQSAKTEVDPKPIPVRNPKPELVPWPPETFAFAGHKAGDEWSANDLGMKFCWCPAGTFIMGSPQEEKDRSRVSNEDQVEVKLTRGFWLGKYEATQGEWGNVMGAKSLQDLKSVFEAYGKGPRYPIYWVSHYAATTFCRKLTEQERKAGRLPPGWEYCLPTEAQWEYACRAGTKTATAFGDQLSSSQANFNGNFPYNGAAQGPWLRRTQPVGSYRPNGWGLYDMHGNVAEWCRDWSPTALPGGINPEVNIGDWWRVVRGGSWFDYGVNCRSAARSYAQWDEGNHDRGFRVAIVLSDPKPTPVPEAIDPRPLPPGMLVNSIGMQLAPIPAGRFLMGSPEDEPGRQGLGSDELDYEWLHPVTIREPFYLGVYLVTQGEYQRVMGKLRGYQPSYFSHEGGGKASVRGFQDTNQFPRENVTLEDVQEFCRRLSDLPEEKKWGRVYRLPTEAEWEYACRAGTTTPYYFGNTISPEQANFGNNLGRTSPVGSYKNPNAFGLYDMHGNLLEACADEYLPYQIDQRMNSHIHYYVLRGGYWGVVGQGCRSAARYNSAPGNNYSGFRVALSAGAWRPKPEELTFNPKPPAPVTRVEPQPLAPPTNPKPHEQPASNPAVVAALGNLQSKDSKTRWAAADHLAALEPDANRVAVAKTLEGMLIDADFFVQGAAMKALCVWGGPENVPRLIAMTRDTNIFNRGHAMVVLGALKDVRGAEALAQRLSEGFDRNGASQYLRQMGAIAEPAVTRVLTSGNKAARIEACKILRDIGTKQCFAALEGAAKSSDADVAKEAKQTLGDLRP